MDLLDEVDLGNNFTDLTFPITFDTSGDSTGSPEYSGGSSPPLLPPALDFEGLQPELKATKKTQQQRKKKNKDDDDDDFRPSFDGDDEDDDTPHSSLEQPNNNSRRRGTKKKPTARKSKRKRKTFGGKDPSSDPNALETSLTLDRGTLLTITSGEFDDMVSRVSSQRELTSDEVKEVRRQKRLIKNRESAALSRDRKKQAMQSLRTENERLKEELASFRSKQQDMESRNTYMQSLLQKTSHWADYVTKFGTSTTTSNNNTSLSSSRNVRAASTVLFVMLFSFGLILNAQLIPGASTNGLSFTNVAHLAQQHASKVGENANLRKLMSIAEDLPLPTTGSDGVRLAVDHQLLERLKSGDFLRSDENETYPYLPIVDEDDEDDDDDNHQQLLQQPNVFLYCQKSKQVGNGGDTIALMLPKSTLSRDSLLLKHAVDPTDDLIQVHCKLVPKATEEVY